MAGRGCQGHSRRSHKYIFIMQIENKNLSHSSRGTTNVRSSIGFLQLYLQSALFNLISHGKGRLLEWAVLVLLLEYVVVYLRCATLSLETWHRTPSEFFHGLIFKSTFCCGCYKQATYLPSFAVAHAFLYLSRGGILLGEGDKVYLRLETTSA